MGRSIFAIHDGGSGCAFYRVMMPMGELAKHGYEVELCNGDVENGHGATLSNMLGHDIVLGQRVNSPNGLESWRRVRTPLTRTVFEIDDDVFSITQENWGAYQLFRRPDIIDATVHCMEVVDLVTVTTPVLAEVMGEYNPNVAILPNHIPAWVCDHERTRRDRPCIGWMGGASHGRDIHIMVPSVRRFLDRFPGWDLHLIGTDYRPTIKRSNVFFSPWVHVTGDPDGFYKSMDFDIGLAPLLPTKFARSKSALKCLEYGALGIPVIATDIEPYNDYVIHGETGFIARRDHEWLKYMSLLAEDADLRETMGKRARDMARQWTIERGWKLWADAYEGLFKRRS